MRVLFCGDRNWTNYEIVYEIMAKFQDDIDCVIEGEAKGADTLARQAAEAHGIPVIAFPADWKKYGRAAGPIRNKQMLDEGRPDRVVAFHNDIENSKGTKNMVEQAKKRGIPTKVVKES